MPLAAPSTELYPAVPATELKRLKLFRNVPARNLAVLEGKVRQATVPQGGTILELAQTERPFHSFYFVVKGQVKAIGLDEEARTVPLNFLRKGDFFVDKSFNWRSQVATKMIALTDVELLIVPRNEMKHVSDHFQPLQDQIRSLSERIDYRNRIYSEDKYARSVLEFLIDNELTNASRIKITQLDKCIECNICYKECETRHGFQRLERGYARFGVLDFAKSCLTCFYPTCIPSCPVDAILYNVQNGEVEILDSCIGCAACERACQYGAIKMYKVDPADPRYARFLEGNRKIKPKFVADKCNHCDGYEDLACITNCPTGAIIEVEAGDLLENPRIFGTGDGASRPLPSLIKAAPIDAFLQKIYVAMILFVAAFLSYEVFALVRFPEISFLKIAQESGLIPAKFNLKFETGTDFCNFLGNVGFSFIFFGMTYPLRKAFPRFFKYAGKQQTWLDIHNTCGILGTILITFHTGFKFPLQPDTFGFLALIVVMLSGVFGRFLFLMIPRGVAGTELKLKEIEEEDAAITQKLDALFEGSKKHRAYIDRVVASIAQNPAVMPTVRDLFKAVFKTWMLLFTLRLRAPKDVAINKRQIDPFLELLHDKIRLKRNASFMSLSHRLFLVWRYIHRPFAYIMCAIVFGHIIFNLILNPKL